MSEGSQPQGAAPGTTTTPAPSIDMDRSFLLVHLLSHPPPHVTIILPPNAKSGWDVDVKALDRIPDAVMQQPKASSSVPFEWDLSHLPLRTPVSSGGTILSSTGVKQRRPSAFLRGWRLFTKKFPNRHVPHFVEVQLRKLDMQEQQQGAAAGGQTAAAVPPGTAAASAAIDNKSKHSGILQRRKPPSLLASSPRTAAEEDRLANTNALSPAGGEAETVGVESHHTLSLAEMAVCAPHRKSFRSSTHVSSIPTKYPDLPVIESVCVAQCHIMESLEEDIDEFHSLVYDHVLLATGMFLTVDSANHAHQVLDLIRPALGISDEQHASSMRHLANPQQAGIIDCTVHPDQMRFEQVMLDHEAAADSLPVWRRIASSRGVSDDDPFPEKATRFLAICAKGAKAAGSPPSPAGAGKDDDVVSLPPTVCALLLAGVIQCIFFSINPDTVLCVNEDEIESLIQLLQRSLRIDDSVAPYCRLHGLILANRAMLANQTSQAKAADIQRNFMDKLADLLPFIDTANIEDQPLTNFTLYKVFVLQEVVESSLILMDWFESIESAALCRSISQAFCATCTALPPLFLSVYIRCNGKPLACGRSVDSALMELLCHFVGAALLREIGDPAQWLDPSKPVAQVIETIDKACRRPTPFLRVFSEYLPQAQALVVPMFLQLASYVFSLYWGRSVRDVSSTTMPPQFLEGTRALYFYVTAKLPEDIRQLGGLMDLIHDAFATHLSWLVPLYERHVNNVAEELNHYLVSRSDGATAVRWGVDDAITVNELERLFDLIQEGLKPLHFSLCPRMDVVHQKFLAVSLSAVGRLAQLVCGPLILPSIEDQERDTPELFYPNSASPPPPSSPNAPFSTLPHYPLKLGICKQHLMRAEKLKPLLQGYSPQDALSRMKHLQRIRNNLQSLVDTYYASVWCSALSFHRIHHSKDKAVGHPQHIDPSKGAKHVSTTPLLTDSGSASTADGSSNTTTVTEEDQRAMLQHPTILTLKSLLDEVLSNLGRFSGDIAEALALRVVHYGPLNGELHEKYLRLDMKYYRNHKHDKKLLLAEGKNAHMKPLYPQFTVDTALDYVERELRAFVRFADTPESIVRISAHMYAHFMSVFAFLLLDGGDERFFYPEQATALRGELEIAKKFFTVNVPDIDITPNHSEFWGLLEGHAGVIEPTKWWTAGEAITETLDSLLQTAFAAPSEDLLNGTEATPGYAAMVEINNDSAYCRYLVRKILLHRKDASAKKFVRSIS